MATTGAIKCPSIEKFYQEPGLESHQNRRWFRKLCVSYKIVKENISFRSSRPEPFCKKGVLRNFAKFTGKHLFLKKRLWHRCFPVNFVKFLRTPSFIEHP